MSRAVVATEGGRAVNAPDEIIFNDRRVISHMTAREKEIYHYGYLAAGIKIAADIEERGAEGFVTTEGAARIARGTA